MENEINTSNDYSNQQSVQFNVLDQWNINITFSTNNMEAYADFIPTKNSDVHLSLEDVKTIFIRANVAYGILWDEITEVLEECNTYHRPARNVKVAKGILPDTEISEYYEFNSQLARQETVDDKAQINYRERSPFTIVKQGQILARMKPKKPGKEGKTVQGEVLPFNIITPQGVSGGQNTRTEKGVIASTIHGQLINTKKELSVDESLLIKGSVGYATGHIAFPGDVTIIGTVSDGFKIFSGGSLLIKQTLDLTEVVTKGDLTVAGGIIGRGSGIIKCGGVIRTKFIENCHVAARKAVIVDIEILNSNIYSLDTVLMTEKGKIIGGDTYAVNGLKAGGLGKKGSGTARIHCGIDFTVQQEVEKYSNQLHAISSKLSKLKEWVNNPVPDKEIQTKIEELYRRLEDEQQVASTRITELMDKIHINNLATVEVMGDIIPGTFIEICQASMYAEELMQRVRIRIDITTGKLVSEPL